MGCGATHGTVARVCCGRQATGATPTVHKVRSSSERGRCVTHWRSDGTTAPHAEHTAREGALLVCFTDKKTGMKKTRMKKGHVAAGAK